MARQEQPDDVELIARMRHGDRAAMRALYELHAAAVYRAVYARILDRSSVDDAVQDVFFLLWKKRRVLTIAGSSALPWLLVTARYTVMNANRLSARREHISLHDFHSPEAEEGTDVETRALLDAVESAVRALPEFDQRVYKACLVEGLSYDEAAKRLGATQGAIRNRLSRVRSRIRHDENVRNAQ